MLKQNLLTLLLIFAFFEMFPQQIESISIDAEKMPFEEFVLQIEKQSRFHFYYRKEWVDSVKISVNVQGQGIDAVMQQALKETSLKFTVYQRSVFITAEREIFAELPPDYFDNRKTLPQRIEFDYSEYEKREKKKRSIEEKVYTIGVADGDLRKSATLAGTIANSSSGEPVIGASIIIDGLSTGVSSDMNGFYSLPIPKGNQSLTISSLGMKTTKRRLNVLGSGKLNIELDEDVTPLREVVIESDRDEKVMSLKLGTEKLDIKTMKQMPSVLGEIDVLKIILTLPGVQSVGEGSSGVNVRGGATNQNLILFNDAVVYNPTHLFGFFSAFNPDILKTVELYKSGVNAEYGGRLSSVLDVSSREGNLKKFTASGGISPITSRIMVEGPVKKDQTSFLLSGRSTYSNWLLRQIDSDEFQKSIASFYDVNASFYHKFNDKNSIQLSGYTSHDEFKLNSDTLYSYGETNASLKFKHVFNNKLYGILTGTFTDYSYDVASDEVPAQASEMSFGIKQGSAKADFSYFLNPRQTITAGLQTTFYKLNPGSRIPTHPESDARAKVLDDEQGVEAALYIGENYEVTPRLSVYAGVRYSFYQYLGPRDVYQYSDEVSKSEQSIYDTLSFSRGKPIATYHGAEPRLSARYSIGRNSSVKLSYNRMRQYIQMLSNTTAIAPTDIWKLSDRYIKPQVGDQISAGFYQNIKGGSMEFSTEVYYKIMKNSLDYKDGATLLLNPHIETDALNARGKAYGLELMLKKPGGKLNGWVSYTYSRTFLKTISNNANELVNNGNYYKNNYDKPHAANFISNYKFNRRFNFSLNFTYSTGRPITIPLAKYQINGIERTFYSERNEFRIPDYFRTDVSINIEGNHKIRKLAHSSWTLAVYNLTGRANAYSVFFVTEGQEIKGYKLSVFARPIPTITYNFRF
jgi:hypothetical protein